MGAEGAEAPTGFSPHGLHTYAQVVAYGSDPVRDPVKAAETLPHISICVYAPGVYIYTSKQGFS